MNVLTIQNSRIQNSNILDIFKRGFKPRLKLALGVDVGVLNPLIYDNQFPILNNYCYVI